MNLYNSDKQSLISIRQASEILQVSLATIRRWEGNGVLRSTRPNGLTRFFVCREIEEYKNNRPLTISDASRMLNISKATLRRWDKKGEIKPKRNNHGDRLYDEEYLAQLAKNRKNKGGKPPYNPSLSLRSPEQRGIGSFNRRHRFLILIAILVVLLPIFYLVNKYASDVRAIQWWPSGERFAYRKQLTVTNSSAVTLSANTTIAITIDTQSLYRQGKLQSDCDDLRILYQPNSSTSTELTRHLVYGSNASGALTCSTSTNTKVFIPLQASLASAASSTDYLAYYGNTAATTPSSTDNAFDISSIDATLVCPFDGSTTCVAGETPSTATGAIRYSGSKSAMSFDGFDDYVSFTGPTGLSSFTIEGWLNPQVNTKNSTFGEIIGYVSGTDNGSVSVGIYNGTTLYFSIGNWNTASRKITTPVTMGSWVHFVAVYDGTNFALYKNGTLVEQKLEQNGTPPTSITGQLGTSNGAYYYKGLMDEIRISNSVRYASNFTSPTVPLIRDSNTLRLFHFDENGDDPRNTGKTIDDSGNGNHGTITGAKYVAGLVGVDASTSDTGNVVNQSYAKHEGIFIEEGTTNKITNPSFENATYDTNWTVGSNLTATANTTAPYYKFGAKSAKLVASATAISSNTNMFYTSINAGSTATHMLSAYVYDGTSGNVGGTVSATNAKLVYNGTAQTTTYTDMGGGWWRLTYTAAGINSAADYGVEAQVSKTIYVDGIQLEALAYATTYTDGSLGTSYAWTGTANNSTSTRAVASLQYANQGIGAVGALSVWFKPNNNASRPHGCCDHLIDLSTNDFRPTIYRNSTSTMQAGLYDGAWKWGSSLTIADNKWNHAVLTWDANNELLGFYINGSGSEASLTLNYVNPTGNWIIGRGQAGGLSMYVFSDLRIFDTKFNSTQVTDLYQAGLVSHAEQPQVDQFSANKGEQPLSIWHMDEATGSTTYDSSLYHHDLTLGTGSSAPTWRTDHVASFNPRSTFLRFDGSNDYASRVTDTDFNPGTDSFTVGGWFRHPSTQSGTGTILTRYGTAGYKVYMNSSGFICFGIDDDSTWGPDDSACTTTSYADSSWHYFSAVKTSTTSIAIFIDGVQRTINSSLTATSTLNTSSTIYLGIDSDAASNPWTGDLDDFLTYNYARTAAQIKADYLKVARTGSLLGAQTTDPLANGLVGYWKMDESATPSLDSSGNGLSGTWVGDTAATTGKFGNGVTLDGTGDYISGADTGLPTGGVPRTLAAWFKTSKNHTLGTYSIIGAYGTAGTNQNNTIGVGYDANVTQNTFFVSQHGNAVSSTTTVNDDLWHFGTATFDGTTWKVYVDGVYSNSKVMTTSTVLTGTSMRIGSYTDNTLPWQGKIDEARIYNRALSPAEVSQLYNFAPGPVGHWKMDEATGTSAKDSSGNGYTGTITGATWKNGKYGSGLSFSGGSDAVAVTDGTNSVLDVSTISMEAWVNRASATVSQGRIISKGGDIYVLYTDVHNNVLCYMVGLSGSLTSTTVLPANTWTHTTCTYDGTTRKLFINGILEVSDTPTGSITADNQDLDIGNYSNESSNFVFPGKIDDAKIYNYARTQKQIIEDMNAGHPTGGSPVGSTVATWHMDDMEGTVAEDSSINNNDLTLSSRSWTQSGKVNGAWNGTNAVWLSRADDADFDVSATDDYSITGWVKSDSATNPGAVEYVVNKASSVIAGYAVYFNTSGNLCFGIDDDTTWNPDIASCTTTDVYDNSWHHFSAVRDTVADKTYIYVDAVLKDSDSDSTTATLANSLSLYVGDRDGTDNGDEFAGDIDEINIYRSALNAADVKIVMNNNSSVAVSVLGATEASTLSDGAGNAPVGEWNMNEGVDNTCTGGTNDVCDVSGNGNDGANSGPVWTAGKNGSGLKFDGVDDYVNVADNNTLDLGTADFTISTWIYPTNNSPSNKEWPFISKTAGPANNGYVLETSSWGTTGTQISISCYFTVLGGSYQGCGSSNSININQWSNVAITRVGTTVKLFINGNWKSTTTHTNLGIDLSNNVSLKIGGQDVWNYGSLYNGSIDQVRVYNYARSASQIAYDYNRGRPVAHWRLDECQGNTAYGSPLGATYDSTLNGTITIGASGTQTSAGTCGSGTSTEAWNGGTTGKFNSSLNFDGTDDYVDMGNVVPFDFGSTFSISAWVKHSMSGGGNIVTKQENSGTYRGYGFGLNGAGKYEFFIYNAGGIVVDASANNNDGNWHHVSWTYSGNSDPSGVVLYVDGVAASMTTTVNNSVASILTSASFQLSGRAGANNLFIGQIDDVQIFNYALSAAQVKKVMNEGAVRYGPATGAP